MNPDNTTEGFLSNALAKLQQGDLNGAALVLEQAAELQAGAGLAQDRARSLQLAASLRNAAGDTAAAQRLAGQAVAALPGDLPMAVASLAQRGVALAAEGRFEDAEQAFAEAVDKAQQAKLDAHISIALLRERAACLIHDARFAEADAAFAAACRIATARIGSFLRTEQARLLSDAGEYERARAALPGGNSEDAQLMAEILVERARIARAGQHLDQARQDASAARAKSLEAVAPVPFFAASVELAQVCDAQGQRVAAYASLAAAWATLSDLLGRDVARSWVEPCLLALQLKWGDAAFADIKREYEVQRRTQIQSGPARAGSPP